MTHYHHDGNRRDMHRCLAIYFCIIVLFGAGASAATSSAWKFRSDLINSGVYDDGGKRPAGDLIWTFHTGEFVRSTPAVVNGIVYIGGNNDGFIHAFDASTGAPLWNYTVPTGAAQSAPAVANGIVCIGEWNNTIYALNASTGAFLWNYATRGIVRSSPSIADGITFIGCDDKNLYALNASTGSLIWNYTTGNEVHSSPAVANGIVYVGSDDHFLYALNASTGALLWKYATGDAVGSSPAVANGIVYVGSDDTALYALDSSTGALLWNYTTGGFVRSSVAVANGVVYVGSYDHKLYAFNASTGALIWDYNAGDAVYSSPAVANGVVYVGSLTNGGRNVHALDASTGSLLWGYTTGGSVYSSPAVANGMIYVGSDDGTLYAFGTASGKPPDSISRLRITNATLDAITWNWTDPVSAGFDHVMIYLDGAFRDNVTKGGKTYTATGLAPATSHTLATRTVGTGGMVNMTWVNSTAWTELASRATGWRFRSDLSNSGVYDDGGTRPGNGLLWKYMTENYYGSRPVVINGTVYIGGDYRVNALDAFTGKPLWNTLTGTVLSSPAVAGGVVYIGGARVSLYALNSSTGALIWNYTTGISVQSCPAVAHGVVYFGSLDNNVYAVSESTGALVWSYHTGDYVYSSPAVDNGVVYVTSRDRQLYALDASTGALLWNYTTGRELSSTPVAVHGVVYIRDMDGNFYALNAENGAVLWHYARINSDPAVANGVLYIGSMDHNLYALAAATGELLWNYTTGDYVSSSPSVANGVVYFGSNDKKLYALDSATGMLLWNYTTGAGISSGPAVADGVVYALSDDGYLYALAALPDEAPGSVTDLHPTTTQGVRITWAWTDPPPIGFSHVMVYLDGVFQENVTRGAETWTATGLAPSTTHTIATRTVGAKGMINATWVNDTVTTGALSITRLDPPAVVEDSAPFTLDVYGMGFTGQSTILWNGEGLATRVLQSDHLNTEIPGELVRHPGHVNITVSDEVSGELSNSLFLPITDNPSAPKAPKFRSDLNNSGVYDDGGRRPGGTLLWNFTTGAAASSSPSVVDGVVYVGSQDRFLYALDSSTGALLWKYDSDEYLGFESSSPAVANGIVYIGGMKYKIHALDASTGALLWRYKMPASTTTRSAVSSSPAVVDGTVYIGNFDGNVYAFNASTGALLWNYTTSSPIFSSPAVANGVLYIGSYDHNLYALDGSTGALLWSYSTGNSIYSSPAVANGVVYIGSIDHNLYALDGSTGALLWSYSTGNSIYSSPAVANGVVYCGSYDNNTYALDASSGALLWNFTAGSRMSSSPAVANGVVYASSLDKNLYALNATTGMLLWNYRVGGGSSSPAVIQEVVYIGSQDGNIYAIGSLAPHPPVANFTANTTRGIVPDTVLFSDRSTGSPPLSYQWDFGDDSPNATVQNPVHTFSTAGIFNVTLTVSNDAGNSTVMIQHTVSARPPPAGGEKAYYLVHSNVEGASVYFDGNWFEGNITNGTLLVQTCTSCAPVWNFTVKKCGYFPLTQNNTRYPHKDETIDLYANLTAPEEPIIPDFSANVTEGPTPLTVGFTLQAVGVVETLNWSFGDGTYSDERDPVHTYTGAGNYTVSVYAANSACQENTLAKPGFVRVGPPAPFDADVVSGTAPLRVQFTETATGNPWFRLWNFGDSPISFDGKNPVHVYQSAGTFTVTLTTIDPYLHMYTRTGYIRVIAGPKADFLTNVTSGFAPLAVQFTDTSAGSPMSWLWDFGDGATSAEQNPVHTYASGGTYTVRLTASNAAGSGSVTKTGYVVVPILPFYGTGFA